MQNDLPPPQRRSIRLRHFDYTSAGAYAVTICTLGRASLFGEIKDGEMRLNSAGEIAKREWSRSAEMRREITLDEFVIMPNHMHGIIWIEHIDDRRDGKALPRAAHEGGRPPDAPTSRPASHSLGALINGYKAAVTRQLAKAGLVSGASPWQRNYYEHVIRNDHDLDRIRHYIRDNPACWALDHENPDRANSPS
jgi:putative transposase